MKFILLVHHDETVFETFSDERKGELLKDIKVGDKIAFELDWDGKAGTITKLDKAP